MGKKVIKMYLHGDKSDNWNTGLELGLSDEAIEKNFKYALYEVECEVEVDLETGEARLLGARDA